MDIKNLSQLLAEPIQVTDVENAAPLPFMEHKLGAKRHSSACMKRKRQWGSDQIGTGVWRYCPFCGADSIEEPASSALQVTHGGAMSGSGGIGVMFRSMYTVLYTILNYERV